MSADFDKAIDRAVRGMLDVEPAAGLRQRVLDELAAPGLPSRVASSFRWKILVPVAAAAVVMLALLLPRNAPQKSETTTVAAPPAANPLTVQAPGPGLRTAQGSAQSGLPAAPAAAVRRTDRIVAAATYTPAAPPAGDIDPLETLAPIQVAPVAPRAIAQPVITIPPLNPIADLEIAPLSPPERRN